jgi:hypothetical protein
MGRSAGARVLCGLLLLAAVGCSRGPSDAAIAASARQRLGADQRVSASGVEVSTSHGVVTLSGSVPNEAVRSAAAEDVSRTDGLKVLVNNVRIAESQQAIESLEPETPKAAAKVATAAKPSAGLPKKSDTSAGLPKRSETSSLPIVTDSSSQAPTAKPVAATAMPNPAASLPTTSGPTSTAIGIGSNTTPATSVPPAAAVEKVSVPYGTVLSVRMLDTVSSDLNDVGDKFTGSLASPVMINDKVVIPAEAGVEGKVVAVQSSGKFAGRSSLTVELSSVAYNGKSYSLRTSKFSQEGKSRTTRSAETIGGGAGIGAILGGLLGGGMGAAIGAAIGAGVGTGVQARSKASPVELPAETVLSFRLNSPLEVEAASTLQSAPGAAPGSSSDPFPNDRPVLKRRPGSGTADPAPDATPPDTTSSPNNDAPPVLKRRPN